MEKCKNIRDILLARYKRKSFLQCIVTGDEKWIYTVNTKRYQQHLTDSNRSLLETGPAYQKRQHKVISLRDNAPPPIGPRHVGSSELGISTPDLVPSDYYLFASMSHALAEQRLVSYEDVKKWFDE